MIRETLTWLILLLPLAAAAGITLFTLSDRRRSAGLSIGAVVLAFVLSLVLFRWPGLENGPREYAVPWLAVGQLQVDLGLRLDWLSVLMLVIVTGVASVIHIYSWGYLAEDRSVPRYFACLSLFTFSMLGIVLANNFVLLFVFWELVGVSSYLLIGFWYERPTAADACKKAFLTNRVGDFGFLLGILTVWATLGSVHFGELEQALAANPQALGALATAAGLLIFCGAMGKSAQFPLHVWLPDAMEGPTPVSALIHAATMVAAGVYMLCRVFFLLDAEGSQALAVIAWVGGVTALLAAVIATQQNDIKRILAYSTLSQLGYMVMAVGLSGPTPAMYHLTTHAFFKALLFLGAGSVIVALHHEQDIWKMGALSGKMRITFWTFLLATLALCGVPPFSGFFSKDEILLQAYGLDHWPLFLLGVGVAALTSFYMFRLVFVAFLGPAKSQAPDHAHETPGVMTWPLRVLAVPTVLAGFWGIEYAYARQLPSQLAPSGGSWYDHLLAPFHEPVPVWSGLGAVAVGFVTAFALYRRAVKDPLPEKLGALATWIRGKFFFDELYAWLIARTQDALATAVDAFDRWVLAGAIVRGTHGTTELFGRALRLVQTGNLQTYAWLFAAGVAVVVFLALR
jgi:NADH-quinone oxidoreductase subunit L